MILGAIGLCEKIELGNSPDMRGISIIPCPDLATIREDGEASISLRLGRWFATVKQSKETHLELYRGDTLPEDRVASSTFVPFGGKYVLHPGRFVLGCTLEWIRMPVDFAAYVVGKSKLGRRGIIIETASGVHPGFAGCITLEIANVGEIPVNLRSGMRICQLFFHSVKAGGDKAKTSLSGHRKPRVGQIGEDDILRKLMSHAPAPVRGQ